jgi:hypothetical protein
MMKVKNAGLAQQNGFGNPVVHCLLKLAKGTVQPNTLQRRV